MPLAQLQQCKYKCDHSHSQSVSHSLLSFPVKMLEVVNPSVRFHLPNSQEMVQGVSINLKGFLKKCDSCGIKRPPESDIRLQLRRTKRCLTATKQWFLPEGYPHVSDISHVPREDFTVSKAAVSIPRDCIPEEFFQCLQQSSVKKRHKHKHKKKKKYQRGWLF